MTNVICIDCGEPERVPIDTVIPEGGWSCSECRVEAAIEEAS